MTAATVSGATLPDALTARADALGDSRAATFLADGAGPAESWTYGELERRARSIGAQLGELFAPGTRAMLLYPPGLEYVAAFFGCLYAGVVAVPAYPPHPARLDRTLPRLRSLIEDAEPEAALTTSALEQYVAELDLAGDLATDWTYTDGVDRAAADGWQRPDIDAGTTAFLQYTSGSTARPKGVMVSHGNLLDNIARIGEALGARDGDPTVTWLPPYHDMGLIGCILGPLLWRGETVMMAPDSFLARPASWLEAIHEYRGALVAAPNFAYDLCVRRVTDEEVAALDLSSLRGMVNGAEPVRDGTLEAFAAKFAPAGLRREALRPCYGLAECTLMVAAGAYHGPHSVRRFDREALAAKRAVRQRGGTALVSCGRPVRGFDVRIVDPDTAEERPAGEIGEIWTAGDSITGGYWANPDATRETCGATLASAPGQRFLRTGDLGFLLDGELYVTGRAKDILIVRGRNLAPHDIENTIQAVDPALRPGCGAAFALGDEPNDERVAAVQEVRREVGADDFDRLMRAARQAVVEDHGVALDRVVLIRAGSLPKTSSGKVQRAATRAALAGGRLDVVAEWNAAEARGSTTPAAARPAVDDLAGWLRAQIAAELDLEPAAVDPDTPFVDLGIGSAQAVSLTAALERMIGRTIEQTAFWDHPTIRRLAVHLQDERDPAARAAIRFPPANRRTDDRIALVGLSCRFPGAEDPLAFWRMLAEGGTGVGPRPVDRWPAASDDPRGPERGGYLGAVDGFEPAAFGIGEREAARIDPQQRLLLELAWEALEDGGILVDSLRGSSTGVFVGVSSSDYSLRQFGSSAELDAFACTGNAHSIAANRISYVFDLQGPSVAVDTACSSSAVAIHMACKSLAAGECEVALAGGVNLILSPNVGVAFSEAGVVAPDGVCKAFDASADGYVRSEGGGLVVLMPLAAARAGRQRVYALVAGSAVNNDGRTNGLMAPSRQAQEKVLASALADAGVSPGDIEYVEAHGTGTKLGDAVELAALTSVLGTPASREQDCRLGSVKSNIGHLEAAAGVAGVVKVALALDRGQLPPTVNLREPTAQTDWESNGLRLQTARERWIDERGPRRAGVSSFGFGGTNAHLVLESAPAPRARAREIDGGHLLTVSARSEESLRRVADELASQLESEDAPDVAAVCRTAAVRRPHHARRLAAVGADRHELAEALRAHVAGAPHGALVTGTAGTGESRGVGFLFSGQGCQWARMGVGLARHEPAFESALARCDAAIRDHTGWSVLAELERDEGSSRLAETDVCQPAVFAVQVALAELFESWGIAPGAVVGHSLGEIAAAHVSGALVLEDAVRVVCERGRIMRRVEGDGAMALIELSPGAVESVVAELGVDAWIAAVNAPATTVVSGLRPAVEQVVEVLTGRDVYARVVPGVAIAGHCPLIEHICDDFAAAIDGIRPRRTRLPFVSSVVGAELAGEGLGPAYWRRNLRDPVRYADAVATLASSSPGALVEVGPHPVLTVATRSTLEHAATDARVLPAMRRGSEDRTVPLAAAGALHVTGHGLDWDAICPDAGPPVSLPPHQWERTRHWLDVDEPASRHRAPSSRDGSAPPLYAESWRPVRGAAARSSTGNWLVLCDEHGVGREVAALLVDAGHHCLLARPGGDVAAAVAEATRELPPGELHTLHCSALDTPLGGDDHVHDAALSLVAWMQATGEWSPARRGSLYLVTAGAHEVVQPDAPVQPQQALVWGLARAAAAELPDLRQIRVDLQAPLGARAASDLFDLVTSEVDEPEIAIRGGTRYARRLTPLREGGDPAVRLLDADATYLVTGGLGMIGLRLASWLAERGARRVVLLGRRAGTERDARAGGDLRARGIDVRVMAADVSDPDALAAALEAVRAAGSPLRGVFHAAGVLRDASLAALEPESFREVCAPKVRGAWNLHRLTREDDLDHFVLISSAAAALGSPGQGAYAAANAFLDALARHRTAQGLPATSIGWGPWGGGGLAMEAVERGWMERFGVTAFEPEEAIELLEPALAARVPYLLAAAVDWRRLVEVAPEQARLVDELVDRQASNGAAKAATAPSHHDASTFVSSAIARLAGLAPDDLDPDATLDSLGIDSLQAIELRDSVRAELGVSISIRLLESGPTLGALLAEVGRLQAGGAPTPELPVVNGGDGPADASMRAAVARGLGIAAAPPRRAPQLDPSYPAGRPAPDEETIAAVESARSVVPRAVAVLERGIADGLHPGAQLYVSHAGDPLANFGIGWARSGRPMTPRTILPWFCCVKPALAIAFAQMWEGGLVEPDTRICEVIPEFESGGKDAVTYRHVLTHTVGLWPDPVYRVFGRGRDEVLQAIMDAPLPDDARPGHQVAYSTLWGWFMLAETVERLSGLGYHDYVDERVLAPLGIEDVFTILSGDALEDVEARIGLVYDVDCAEPSALAHLRRPEHFARRMPGMDGLGPVAGLGRLLESLLDQPPGDGILRPQTQAALTARHRVGFYDLHHRSHISWGLGVPVDGWHFGSHCSARSFGHTGLRSAIAVADPDHRLVIAAITNAMLPPGESERDHRGVVDAVYADLGLDVEPDPSPRIVDVHPDVIPPWSEDVLAENRFWRPEPVAA